MGRPVVSRDGLVLIYGRQVERREARLGQSREVAAATGRVPTFHVGVHNAISNEGRFRLNRKALEF